MFKQSTILKVTVFAIGALANHAFSQTPKTPSASQQPAFQSAISSATRWLAAEVPQWMPQHRCASCHHQGDATRALLDARRLGYLRSDQADVLAASIAWSRQPQQWKSNRGDPQASDYRMAEIQFASTLLEATHFDRARLDATANEPLEVTREEHSLQSAGQLLLKSQSTDGSWNLPDVAEPGSPITYGQILLTGQAALCLSVSKDIKHQRAASAAWGWLCEHEPKNVFEASSLLLALNRLEQHGSAALQPAEKKPASEFAKSRCRKLLQPTAGGQVEAGFGPYANSAPENFDTALAILAMCSDRPAQFREQIDASVGYLVRQQDSQGFWQETTRLSMVESYAHRVSTSAWCLRALLAVEQVNRAERK